MRKYYCPVCVSSYQLHKKSDYGVLICNLCGDKLVQIPLLNSKRIIGLVALSAFLAPLLIMIFFVMNELTNEKLPNNFESLVFLSCDT